MNKKVVEKALKTVQKTDSTMLLRSAQSVILTELEGFSLEKTGKIIGRTTRTVSNMKKDFVAGKKPGKNWGGRRKAYLSADEEKAFLESFTKKSEISGIISVSEIQKAYEKKIGKKVAKSTVYDLLDRHDWRKIVPRKSHPKADKKNRKISKKI